MTHSLFFETAYFHYYAAILSLCAVEYRKRPRLSAGHPNTALALGVQGLDAATRDPITPYTCRLDEHTPGAPSMIFERVKSWSVVSRPGRKKH